MNTIVDTTGLYGTVLHYALTIAIVGSTMVYFVYLWYKGRLDLDEGPKWQMLSQDQSANSPENEEPHE